MVGEDCITRDDGQIIYNEIYPALKRNESIGIDFGGVSAYASPFFNYGVGQLLNEFSLEDLNGHLNFVNISSAGTEVLNQVLENAQRFKEITEEKRKEIDEKFFEQANLE